MSALERAQRVHERSGDNPFAIVGNDNDVDVLTVLTQDLQQLSNHALRERIGVFPVHLTIC
jgi:hypothetical protein